jgi:TRAP-type C4-dicarboxylate transport system substrate-binding protein
MHRRPSLTRAFALLAALAVVLTASACSDTNRDKAGGTRTEPPVVLTLANHEVGPHDVQYWVDEVHRRSGGSLRIQVSNRWREREFAYDKATIADVQAGKVQLAKVNARAYDTVGVDSFQAMVAPFLIDNHPLQRRVLASDLMGEMLAGTGKLGLVGLAVLPTRLRKPLGISRPLVTVEDYQGARVGTREGEVVKATFAALGATPVGTIAGVRRSDLDGIELDFGLNEYEQQAKAFTSNVTLWPRPVTLVINRDAFESLTPSQQDALRQAGSAVLSRQFDDQLGHSASDGRILCRRGVRFARASDQDLAALRRTVQPVYDMLEGNAETRSFLRRILAMKQETGAASAPDSPPPCAPSGPAAGAADKKRTALDGVYRTSFTREELAKSPLLDGPAELNDQNWGDFTLTFDRGRVTFTQRNDLDSYSASGTYALDGKAITITFAAGGNAGETFAAQWNLYRDVLTFERLGELPTPFVLKPWRRAG